VIGDLEYVVSIKISSSGNCQDKLFYQSIISKSLILKDFLFSRPYLEIKRMLFMPSIRFIKQVGVIKWAIRYFVRQFMKRILKIGVSLKLPTGLTYFAPIWDPSGSEVYVTNADIDWGSEKLLSSVLGKSGTFIDVGAHTGYYSLYMLPLVSWVYAFEPDAKSYNVLNGYSQDFSNFLTFRNAVSNKSGTIEIEVAGGGYTYLKGTSERKFDQKNTSYEEIEVIKLDDLIDDYKSPITGIKIDVDGSCLDVLEGAIETIRKFKPVVLSELGEVKRLFEICQDIDYIVYAFTRDEKNPQEASFLQMNESLLTSLTKSFSQHSKIKMIFLVPKDKRNFFDDNCSK
jgi:FkbM family methyltransferase